MTDTTCDECGQEHWSVLPLGTLALCHRCAVTAVAPGADAAAARGWADRFLHVVAERERLRLDCTPIPTPDDEP